MKISMVQIFSKKKSDEAKNFLSKFILSIGCAFFAAGFFSCCQEVGPNINLTNGHGSDSIGFVDSTQQKNVLLEDFTATNCSNCPKAGTIIEQLLATHTGRLEVVEDHEGILSIQLLPGDPTFETQDGTDLANYLGPPPYWPSGTIDRHRWVLSPGDTERVIDRSYWSTFVEDELTVPLQVMLGVNTTYDNASRMLTGSVTVDFLQTISEPLNITIVITESGMVAGQLDGLVIDTNYVHHNVLRDIITPVQGETISGTKIQGSAYTYDLGSYYVNPDWNADSCRIIALVAKTQGDYDVLQVMGKPMK